MPKYNNPMINTGYNNNDNNNNNSNKYWECQACTFLNSTISASCKICCNPQPGYKPSKPQQPHFGQLPKPNEPSPHQYEHKVHISC